MPNQKIRTLADPVWTAPSLINNWSNYGSGQEIAGYWRSPDGIVYLRGLIKATTATNRSNMFVLPTGYRPLLIATFAVYAYTSATNPTGVLQVTDQGGVSLPFGATDVAVGVRVSFPAAQ